MAFSNIIFFLFFTSIGITLGKLPRLENHGVSDLDYEPELVGKYHTDAFNVLKEKYGLQNIGRTRSSSEIMLDMKDILIGYCPSSTSENMKSCIQEVNKFTDKNYYTQFNRVNTRAALSEDITQRLENLLRSRKSKEETMKSIQSLKQGFDRNDTKDKIILTALSIAEESFGLWYDVHNDENHPFLFLGVDHNQRRLQQCSDFPALIMKDVDGGTASADNGNSLPKIVIDAVLSSLSFFLLGCISIELELPSPSRLPSTTPTATSSKTPSSVPSVSSKPSSQPSSSPTLVEPSIAPTSSTAPSSLPSVSSQPSNQPSFLPTGTQPTGFPTIIPSQMPTQKPSVEPSFNPSQGPTISFNPTFSLPTLNNIITCIAIIDESDEKSKQYFSEYWTFFRSYYPDRPFCLLQPAIFINAQDEANYPYSSIEISNGIGVPNNYYQDENTIFEVVNRDFGNDNKISDWFELCNLDDLRSEGVGRVAFFIDESGSMDRNTVSASFDNFEERLIAENLEVVAGIYNEDEDWIDPFVTNFGFDGPVPTEDFDNSPPCRVNSLRDDFLRMIIGD